MNYNGGEVLYWFGLLRSHPLTCILEFLRHGVPRKARPGTTYYLLLSLLTGSLWALIGTDTDRYVLHDRWVALGNRG